MKTLIVGGGLAGLMLAQKISSFGEVAVFDKGRGVGGRLATRRADGVRFDHGAQFYRPKEPIRALHDRWLARKLVKLWFSEDGQDHFVAIDGMTALAKDLAVDCKVTLNERVLRLARTDASRWQVDFESGRTEFADQIVFTCPVPQCTEILRTSGIAFPEPLFGVTYAKLLVALIENHPAPFPAGLHGYLEPKNSSIFSIADQQAKGISQSPALTVTLSTETSEPLFAASDDEVLRKTREELRKISPSFEMGTAQVKRWRYGQVIEPYGELFARVADGLYIIGDGFGGASLNGAARSATALGDHFLKICGR